MDTEKNNTKARSGRTSRGKLIGVCVLAVCTAICLGLSFWTVSMAKEQQARVASIDALKSSLTSFEQKVENWKMPEDMEEENYENIKKAALQDAEHGLEVLNKINTDKRIDNETYAKAQAAAQNKTGETYLSIIEKSDEIPVEYLDALGRNTERLEFVSKYFDRDQYQKAPESVKEDLSTVPHYVQWDLDWGYIPYGDGIIGFYGCGPTSLAMVYSYLNQDNTILPSTIAAYSDENGYYVPGVGTNNALLVDTAPLYNASVEALAIDEETVTNALNNGEVLILSMMPGDFTRTGHFIVAYGLQDGKLLIRDPNSYANTNKLWDIQTVLDQSNAIYGYSKLESADGTTTDETVDVYQ